MAAKAPSFQFGEIRSASRSGETSTATYDTATGIALVRDGLLQAHLTDPTSKMSVEKPSVTLCPRTDYVAI